MPWTEKPDDKKAQVIRNKQLQLAQGLIAITEARMAAAFKPGAMKRLKAANEIALNALTNEAAMQTLYSDFAGKADHKYLALSQDLSTPMTTEALPGVAIYVLGPSSDPAAILDLDPPVSQSYLQIFKMSADESETGDLAHPFRKEWSVSAQEYLTNYPWLGAALRDDERRSIQRANLGLENEAAAALDGALNGSSLMLLFHIGRAWLLFPGDAQWGTWRLALQNPTSRKLLGSVNFYKVGHHGSHNATPKEFVEEILKDDFWAMISTNHVKSYPQVPKKELVDSLSSKTKKLVETGKPLEATNEWFTIVRKGVVEAHIPI